MGDVGEWSAVNQRRRAFQGLDQVRLDSIAQQGGHRAVGLEVTRRHGLLGARVAHHDVTEALLQVGEIAREAQDGHDLGRHHDVETILPGKAVCGPAQADGDIAQGAIVHIDDAGPGDAPDIDVQRIAVVDVIVQQRRQQVVRERDRGEVAGEVKIDVFHRRHLRKAAAGGAALHAEHRAHRGLAQAQHGALADSRQCIREADRGGGLAFAGRRRAGRRHQDQPGMLARRQRGQPGRRQLGLVTAIGLERGCRDAGALGDVGDRFEGCCLGDLDVGLHQRGNVLEPIRYSSTARAAWRPSRIAQTTSDWPRRMSPAAKILSRLVR